MSEFVCFVGFVVSDGDQCLFFFPSSRLPVFAVHLLLIFCSTGDFRQAPVEHGRGRLAAGLQRSRSFAGASGSPEAFTARVALAVPRHIAGAREGKMRPDVWSRDVAR